MAAALALVASSLFGEGSTLQLQSALNLPTISRVRPMSLVWHVGQTTWLLRTRALFAPNAFQAGATDCGRLSIIQPLLASMVLGLCPP